MTHAVHTIEDCLEALMGFSAAYSPTFKISPLDTTVFFSMAKQLSKSVALTDRQYELLSGRLSDTYYADQFVSTSFTIDNYKAVLKNTRYPLREIDRSKYIKLVDKPPECPRLTRHEKAPMSNIPWIKIGFPFTKKTIAFVNDLAKETNNYVHLTGERDHYFKCEEDIAYRIVSAFKEKGYEIDEDLIDYYEKLCQIDENRSEYTLQVLDGELKNFHPLTEEHLLETLGKPSVENIVRYRDNSLIFGIQYTDRELLNTALEGVSPLTQKIVERTSPQVLIKPDEWDLDKISDALLELDRFPLLVVVSPENALKDVKDVYESLKGKARSEEISVLFRLDNDTNAKFNNFVKNNHINSPISKNTKIAVIGKDKLPKPLLKAGWYPRSVLRVGSTRIQPKIDQWIYDCDLVIHYDNAATMWAPNYFKRRITQAI